MRLDLEVQTPFSDAQAPDDNLLRLWCEATLEHRVNAAGIVIRVVDEEESQRLNNTYRGFDKPTNVLSFSFDALPVAMSSHLGDVVICAPLVQIEAAAQGKPVTAHWAHLVVHGVLHLLGYDHQDEDQALEMERTEIIIMQKLGFDNPYIEGNAA